MINEYGDILTPQQTVHHYEHKTQKYIISDTTYKFIEKTKKNEYVSVSEYEFMVNTNEKNRKIRLIRPRYINDFILEFQNTVQLFK
jgi:hypothetical protein